ncbi:MAG: RNA polymerase sigma factor [Bacteroidota bacterium]
MTDPEDDILLAQCAVEDTRNAAFARLVRKYQERIYWHVRRIVVDHDDANDVTQNVFVKAWKALSGFRGESSFYTWLYRIATNECLSFLRERKRRALISLEDVEYQLADKLASDPLYSGDRIQLALQQAVMKLPPQQRLVFTMKYFENKKYEEIAEVLGLKVGGLKASYHHAVKKIEKSLQGR